MDVTKHGFIPVGSDWKFYDYPLEVKKSWRFSAQGYWRGTVYTYTVDITVTAYEDVKTRAGTFKAYKLQRQWAQRNPYGGADWTWSDTTWVAPDVKGAVRFTSTNRNTQDWELTSYSLK